MKKKTKHILPKSKLFPDIRLTINPALDNVAPEGNPKKMAEAKRILSNLQGPLPWDKK